MNRYSHVAIGLAAGLGAAAFCGRPDMAVSSALVAAAAASLPDFDYRFGLPPRGRYEPACRPMRRALEHRGALHTPVVAYVLGMIAGSVTGVSWVMLAVSFGYLSHLIADSVSPMGIPWLWPLSKRRYRLGPLKITSGNRRVEWPLAAAVLLVTLWATGLGLPQ